MDEQKLQSELEVKDLAETEEDEEFYEKIEAPKFVDFTKPYTFRTDDRYWFCSRVGCDQKHEEEINPEEISKKFILRVLAARSPNIKLRKALNREHISMKCPLSAPAKPSKPRIPKLSMISSLISHKNGDTQNKTGPCSKDSSTPVAKSRQVAAKYMTAPRNKMCKPNPTSFRSVQNPKTTTVDVIKNRPVAKALVFHSPKKVICIKKSVELQTPLTKICQGMKRLDIASQKKTIKTSTKSKIKKPETEDLSKRNLKICKSDKTSEDLASSKSIKTLKKKIPSKKCDSLHEKVIENESGDMDVDMKWRKKEEDMQPQETSDTSVSNALRAEMNRLSNLEDKENMANAEDHSNEVVEGDMSGQMDDNDDSKENALTHQDNNRSNNQTLGDKIFSKETQKKNKVVQTQETSDTSVSNALRAEMNRLSNLEDKENMANAEDHSNEVVEGDMSGQMDDNDDSKENALTHQDNNRSNNQTLGDKIFSKETQKKNKVVQTVAKCKKPKPTNIKPFRLRTDERGILREAILEKKLHITASEKEDAKDSSMITRAFRVAKNDKFPTGNICGKESSTVKSKPANNATRKRSESTQQRFVTSLKTISQGAVSPRKVRMPSQQLCTINEKSCKLTSDVMVAENKSRAVSGARSTSRGKRPLTIAKEPNFHTSHLPRTCSKKID